MVGVEIETEWKEVGTTAWIVMLEVEEICLEVQEEEEEEWVPEMTIIAGTGIATKLYIIIDLHVYYEFERNLSHVVYFISVMSYYDCVTYNTILLLFEL